MSAYDQLRGLSVRQQFDYVYKNQVWAREDIKGTICGAGSTMNNTKLIKSGLSEFIKKYNITSFVDYGCGDCSWIYPVIKNINYTGMDIVKDMIEENMAIYPDKTFIANDIIDDIPYGDVIFIRDVLEHLSLPDCIEVIKKAIKARPRYIMLSAYYNTKTNGDTKELKYRKRNYMIEPFNFPEPEIYMDDGATKTDRTIGVWRNLDETRL